MNAERPPVFRATSARSLAGLGLAIAAAVAFALAAIALDGGLAPRVSAQETELPAVPIDSVGEDFLHPAPAVPAIPAVPGVPAVPAAPKAPDGMTIRGGGTARTIEGPGGVYKVHAGANDVVQMGEDIVIERGEHVLGHVFAMGGSVTVRGLVDDDVVAMGGDVIVEDGAQIRGDAVSIGGSVDKAPGATVLGSSVSLANVPAGLVGLQGLNFIGHGFDALGRVFTILFWLLVSWVIVILTRDRSRRIVGRIEAETAPSLGYGVLGIAAIAPATIAVALAAVLLVVTIIGIPVAVLLLLGYSLAVVAVLVWGFVLGSAALGGWFIRRLSPRLGAPELVRNTLIGVAAVLGVGLVSSLLGGVGIVVPPAGILGGLLKMVGVLLGCGVLCAGLGAILRTRAGQPAPIPVDWSQAGFGPGAPGMAPPAAPIAPEAPPAPPAPTT